MKKAVASQLIVIRHNLKLLISPKTLTRQVTLHQYRHVASIDRSTSPEVLGYFTHVEF